MGGLPEHALVDWDDHVGKMVECAPMAMTDLHTRSTPRYPIKAANSPATVSAQLADSSHHTSSDVRPQSFLAGVALGAAQAARGRAWTFDPGGIRRKVSFSPKRRLGQEIELQGSNKPAVQVSHGWKGTWGSMLSGVMLGGGGKRR